MPRVPAWGGTPNGRARRPRRRLLLAIGLAIAVAVLPTIALATTVLGYRVSGIQVGVSGPDGFGNFTSSFAGAATSTTQAGEYGLWAASVYRTGFDVNGDAAILGGIFRLKSTVRSVIGAFTSGTVVGPAPSTTPCVNEVFAVNAAMTITAPESGWGTFVGTLTHYRRVIFGFCRTVGASITGTVLLTLGS